VLSRSTRNITSERSVRIDCHNEMVYDWTSDETYAKQRPMGMELEDKTQVPQQYGRQYKFDACNMSFSPGSFTIVSRVLCYMQRDVTFMCAVRWETAMRLG